ncbi:hypothetical protein NX02_19990 [Sphingomonas sanxanigenens DSM 19645 = NX02]|uniref:Flagella basal body P-ring formation protein FlgA C-terminal domain-containing protein n=1 Tax=Sphingomonas sanxanigenens DSM 19645 = NX02 TaxID=1123269 RepID=W0AGI5_9SPHN|nr:hypothetical protein NX02_19990 [Sphingomonas sanxanigenens DSM 19645 = NX02]
MIVGGNILAVAALAGAMTGAPPTDRCVEVVRSLAGGGFPVEADLAPTTCPAVIERAFWFDATSGVVRAQRDIAAHEVVAAPPRDMLALHRPGDPITVEVLIGPVRVQRDVLVVRPTRATQPLLVRSHDGSTFVVKGAP